MAFLTADVVAADSAQIVVAFRSLASLQSLVALEPRQAVNPKGLYIQHYLKAELVVEAKPQLS